MRNWRVRLEGPEIGVRDWSERWEGEIRVRDWIERLE